MKKIILIFISFAFVLTGCGKDEAKQPMTNKQIEKAFKKEGYTIDYAYVATSKMDVIDIKGEDITIRYTSQKTLRVYGDSYILEPQNNEGSDSDYVCIYNYKDDKVSKDYDCTKTDKKEIKNLNEKYTKVLKNIGITQKELMKFGSNKLKQEITNNKSGNAVDVESRLEELGYTLINGSYGLSNNKTDFNGMGVPSSLMVNLDKKQMALIFDAGNTVLLDWANGDVAAEKKADGSMCVYDITNRSWVSDDCGIDESIRLIKFYTGFIDYQSDNNINLSFN